MAVDLLVLHARCYARLHVHVLNLVASWPDKNWRSVQFCVQLGRARDVRILFLRVHPRMPHLPRRGSGVVNQHVGVVRAAGHGAASPANACAGSYMPAIMRNVDHKQLHDSHITHHTIFTHIMFF